VVAPQGVFYPMKGRWTRGTVHATRLSGGQLTAVRPPTEEERQALSARRTGRLGTGQEGREDRHLPDIPALIDPRQFELLSRPGSGLVVIQGGAGSGKTTIGLHRMAYLAFQDRARYAPETMLVVVFNRALASYIERVLPGLGVAGVPVVTFQAWASKQRRKHIPRAPEGYAEHTPPVVSRMKKHPAMLRLLEERVARRVAEARAALLTTAERVGAGALVGRAWDALEGVALSRRLSALSQWLRGERELSGASRAGLDARGASAVQRAVDQQMKKARDVVWDWAELVTDRAALQGALDREAPGAFLPGEVAQAVAWSAEHLSRWVGVEPTDAESLSGEDREGARREAREAREARREARRSRSEDEREVLEDEAPMKALVRAERADRVRRGEDVEDSDDDDDQGPLLGADGRVEEDEPPTLDPEDDALLLRLYQLKRGGLRGAGSQPMAYAHLFVDEAQDLSPVELSVLVGVASEDRSVTLAGDTAQRLLLDNGFSDWARVLGDLGLSRVEVEPLKIGYRSTLEVLQFAREVLGPLADPEPPLATRSGAPVEFHGFQDPGAAVAFLGQALRDLMTEEPWANVAVVARDPARAALYHDGLLRAEVPRLKLVTDQDFTFRPGVEVTDIRQVKGLEWDYVVLVDVNRTWYPADDEARHLLHIGATRAAHQLWVLSTGAPSALVPEYLLRE
jgi:DNA helicase-2/ATP-dependent DNA helicase PcrA